jgi:hypothetical protein
MTGRLDRAEEILGAAKKLLSETRILSACGLLGLAASLAQYLGYLDHLDRRLVTGAIVVGLGALALLLVTAVAHFLKNVWSRMNDRRNLRDDRLALEHFEYLCKDFKRGRDLEAKSQRDVLVYVASDCGDQMFQAPCGNKRLSEMIKLRLIDRVGPAHTDDGLTEYKVRGCVWQLIQDKKGWNMLKSPPWSQLVLGFPWEEDYDPDSAGRGPNHPFLRRPRI